MSGPNCLSLHAAEARPINAIKAKPWSANKTNFSFSPNAVIPTAPAIIANKGRQHGAAKAITRAPTVPRSSSKATVRVRRLVLISAKVSQSRQSRPRSEEFQHSSTPTLDNPSDNSSLLFLFACSQNCDEDAGEFYFHWSSFFVLFLRFFIEPHSWFRNSLFDQFILQIPRSFARLCRVDRRRKFSRSSRRPCRLSLQRGIGRLYRFFSPGRHHALPCRACSCRS